MKTDRQLQDDVRAELVWEASMQASRLGVAVKNGVVTLAGQVDSDAQKRSSERAARRVGGVQALATELTVNQPERGQTTESDIEEALENAMAWSASLPVEAVQVMVECGLVTLSGDVDQQYERQVAADRIR